MTIDKSAGRVRRMFAQIAGRYDLLNLLLSFGIDQSWRRRVVKLVPPVGDGPILDVCCGTADLTLAYRRRSPRRIMIVGADFCRPMLVIGKRKSRRAERIELLEADALQLPFRNDSFQIVCVAFGLRNLSDTEAGLREMVRVCRPAGRVAVLEFSMPTLLPIRLLYGWYFHRLLPWVGQSLARNTQEAYNYLPATVESFPQGEAMAGLFRQAGLCDVAYHRFTFGIATLYEGRK